MQSKSVTIASAAALVLLAICCLSTTQILAVERNVPITLTDTYELSSTDTDDADADVDADRGLVKRQTRERESTGTGVIATGGAAASAAMTAMAISTAAGAPGGAATSRRQNKYDREDMARGNDRTASRVIYRSDEDDDGFESVRQRPVSGARVEPRFSTTGANKANRPPPSPASVSRQMPQEPAPEQRRYEPVQRKYEPEPREVYHPKQRPYKQKRVHDHDDDGDDDCNYDEEDFNPGKQYQKMFNMAIVPMQAYMQNMMGQMIARVPAPKIQDLDTIEEEDRGHWAPAPSRSAYASASASFDTDGDRSRTSSLVSNNGRTRGVVSVTRNGRTQTRRVGSHKDWDDEEED